MFKKRAKRGHKNCSLCGGSGVIEPFAWGNAPAELWNCPGARQHDPKRGLEKR